jgi:hypothetical protein
VRRTRRRTLCQSPESRGRSRCRFEAHRYLQRVFPPVALDRAIQRSSSCLLPGLCSLTATATATSSLGRRPPDAVNLSLTPPHCSCESDVGMSGGEGDARRSSSTYRDEPDTTGSFSTDPDPISDSAGSASPDVPKTPVIGTALATPRIRFLSVRSTPPAPDGSETL